MEKENKVYKGDLLGRSYDANYLKKFGLYDRTVRRRIRYWCFKISFAEQDGKKLKGCPAGLKKYVEGLPGFAGWKYFAKTWDITGTNPFKIVLRLESVWDEWDNVMRRVAIPIDTPPEQIHARIEALADEYARKESRKK